jgi:hypothetical protein
LWQGKEKAVLREIAALPHRQGRSDEVIRREQNYFATQSERMNYDTVAKKGWPIGSGAVESACIHGNAGANAPVNFGPSRDCVPSTPWKKHATNGHWNQLWSAN